MAIYIDDNGNEQDIAPASGGLFSEEELKVKLGGHPQAISTRVGSEKVIIADEAGASKELSPNIKATMLAGRLIVGPVLVCEKDEFEL